jgi:CHASE2 domain-containing sensor protein/signal transduction histidine kinase
MFGTAQPWLWARALGGKDIGRRRRLWIEWFATAILATVLLVSLVETRATARLDNALFDLSLRLRQQAPRADIVIVAIDPKSLLEVGEWPWRRSAMADLIARIARQRPKALACHFLFLFPSTASQDQAVHDAMSLTRTYLGIPHRAATGGRASNVVKPIPRIASAAAGLGAGDAEPDQDGIVRRTFLFEGPAGNRTPRMVLQMARLEGRGPARSSPKHGGDEMVIPFVGRPGSFRTIPAIDVLRGNVPPDAFRNKFVLLGATAPELLDNYPTPLSAADGMPSVEVDANILNALLSGRSIVASSKVTILLQSVALLWLMLIGLVRLGPRENLWLAALMIGLPLAASVSALVLVGIWTPPVAYLMTVAIVIPYWGWRRLNAASAYFTAELSALESQGAATALATSKPAIGGDVVLQQIMLVEDARRRISDLRQFVSDILANFPDPVAVVDRGGRILRTNHAAGEFAARIGASAAPGARIEPVLAGISVYGGESTSLWPPPEQDQIAGPPALAPPTGEGPDGRFYELRFTATRSAANEATGWIVHFADVTPLISAMRQREEALQLLSHDMRSPLSAILATLDNSEFEDAPAALRQRIAGQAERTLALADDFVRLAKAESGDYVREPIDFGHVLQDAADSVWPLAHAAGVKIKVDLGPPDAEYVVLADRSLMTRALVNLLDNAVKFSPPGQTVVCRLKPALLGADVAVACEIADKAGGMTQPKLLTLFKKFSSGRDGVNGAKGVGLGLALVHAVVSRHDGLIGCESAEGDGTTFTITLPLDQFAPNSD